MNAMDTLTRAGLRDLPADLDIPILHGRQVQGDVFAIPTDNDRADFEPVPPEGVVLVAGQHEHRIMGENAEVAFQSGREADVALVRTTVGPAYLVHTAGPDRLGEHYALGLAPGTWIIRRQREKADEERLVRD